MPGCLGPSAKLPRHFFPCAFSKFDPRPLSQNVTTYVFDTHREDRCLYFSTFNCLPPWCNRGINFQAHTTPEGVAAASLYFLPSYTHFAISLPANPKNPSCHACVIMPGRRLFRISARIPNSKPYARIMMADRQP